MINMVKKRLLALFLSIALVFSFSPVGSSYAAYSDDYSYIMDKLKDFGDEDYAELFLVVSAMADGNYEKDIETAMSKLSDVQSNILSENGFDNDAINKVLLSFSQVIKPVDSGYTGESLSDIFMKIKLNGGDLDSYKQELVDIYVFMFASLPSEVKEKDFSRYGDRMDKARVFRDVLKAVYDQGDICARYYESDGRFELVLPSDFISKANGALDNGVSNPIELTADHAGAISVFLDVLSQRINIKKRADYAKEVAKKLGVLEIISGGGGLTPPVEEDTQAPTNVSVSLAEKTDTTVKLSLSAEDESGIAKYHIYRDGKEVGTSASSSYTDTGLTAETTYQYKIKAEDTKGNVSGLSSQINVTTEKEDTEAPTNVSVSLAEKTDTTVKLSLSAKDESGIAKYHIYRDGKEVGTSTSSSYTDSGLTPETTYKYKIKAEDTKGNVSDFSSHISVKTEKEEAQPEDKEAPTDVKVVAGKVADSSISLSLSAKDESGIAKYYIYRDGKQIKQTASSTYEDKGLEAETEYEYKIKAQDKAGNTSEFSSAIKVTTLKKGEQPEDKDAPTDVKVTLKKNDDDTVYLNLSAKDESGIAKYHIYRDGKKIGTTTKDTYRDNGLKEKTKYTYKIKAEDTKGNISAFSADLDVTTEEASSGGGGGGGGGGSSSSDEKGEITKNEDDDNVEIKNEISSDTIDKKVKDDTTTVEVDEDDFKEEVERVVDEMDDTKTDKGQKKKGTIVLDLGKVKSEKAEINIPVKAIEKAKGKGIDMVFKGNDIEISMPADNLVQKSESVKLEVRELKQTQKIMEKINKKLEPGMKSPKLVKVISLDLYKVDSGKEEKIDSSFKEKVKVQIDISDMEVNEDNAVLVFIDDEGNMNIVGRKVEDGKIAVELEHFSYYAVVERDVQFSDLPGHWAQRYICSMASKDVVSGYADGSFKPENNVTRAEFAKLIVEAMELEMEEASGRFSDAKGHWAEGCIETAYKNEIISGYADGTFKPNEKITRAEMAVMISRALGEDSKDDSMQFKDKDKIPTWAASGVEKAAAAGIMNGDPNMNFNPGDSTTRAQAATAIYRLFNK